MKLHNSTAEIYVPDGQPVPAALKRITHLGIGAHQDDLEFMAFHGILECLRQRSGAGVPPVRSGQGRFDDSETHGRDARATTAAWFGGVTCTNGSGSSRAGKYKIFSDEQMLAVRRREQNQAAKLGKFGVMLQLDYPSSAVKSPTDTALKEDLKKILAATKPETVYTHNPADKHDTHIGVVIAAIQALRELPRRQRPKKVIGCEVWRNLDWLPDADKVLMDVSGHDQFAAKLNGVFDSQIAGGKRYDLATLGRRSANATFFDSHATDAATQLIFGMDLTPLVADETKDIAAYVTGFIEKFQDDVKAKLNKRLGRA